MKQTITTKNNSQAIQINRWGYILFMVLVLYFAISGDYDSAITNMGIALIFDPFDQTVKWQERPFYQKAWLLVHVSIVIIGFIYIFLIN